MIGASITESSSSSDPALEPESSWYVTHAQKFDWLQPDSLLFISVVASTLFVVPS